MSDQSSCDMCTRCTSQCVLDILYVSSGVHAIGKTHLRVRDMTRFRDLFCKYARSNLVPLPLLQQTISYKEIFISLQGAVYCESTYFLIQQPLATRLPLLFCEEVLLPLKVTRTIYALLMHHEADACPSPRETTTLSH